jgi:single-stranded DNA-binding protein
MNSGEVTCVMRLACTRNWRDPRTGEWNQWQDLFWVRTYGSHARAASRYLRNGRAVAVQGYLSFHREPEKDMRFEIVAREIQFLDTKGPTSTNTGPQPPEEIIDEDQLTHTHSGPEIVAAGIAG